MRGQSVVVGVERTRGPVTKHRVQIDPLDRELVEEHYDTLRRFAAVTASRDIEPDDLLQEALTRVLSKGSLSDRDHPVAYMRRAIVNLAIDESRRRESRRSALGRLTDRATVVDQYPSDIAILQELSPRARAIIYLAEVDGYRYAEIAEMLDCSETSARMGSMRARRRLKNILAEEAAHG